MRIIPVLDIAAGQAVLAVAGERRSYEPFASALVPGRSVAGAMALGRAYREQLDASACYVADLDAIQGGAPQTQVYSALLDRVGGFGGPLWIDAGVTDTPSAYSILGVGAARVVVGLETLRAFADLAGIVSAVGASRTVFSLDLKFGQALVHPALSDIGSRQLDPIGIAERAVDAGVRSLILLDVGRVGTGVGVDVGLLGELRERLAHVELLAGGGVLEPRDLVRLRDAGCDAALIGSSLHAGRVAPADVKTLEGKGPGRAQSESKEVRNVAD